MVRRSFGMAFAVVVLSVGLLCFGATSAFAATTVKVNPKAGSDIAKVVQEKLDKAHSKATSKNKYTIKVKPGSYKLGATLKIYGNTTLDLTGVKLKASKSTTNMIKVGDTPLDKKKGYAYKNISIIGGDLNNSGLTNTCVVIGHAKNVTLKNVSVHNSKNAHLVEVAGTDGFTATGCKFYDQVQTKSAKVETPEAIQLDIHIKKHMKTYKSEVLATKNVTISNCSFSNVPRGVGSHTAILNVPMTNMTFKNNTFTNCKSGAIQVLNYENCLVEGNTVTNSPRGVVVYTVNIKGVFLPSTLAKEGGVKTKVSSKYKTPKDNQNIVVRNNTISLAGTDIYAEAENVGIYVGGINFKSALKKNASTDAIPKGDYYASGITVTGNKITTIGHGIRLSDARKATISNNSVTFKKGGKSGNFYGIQLTNACKNVAITNNTVDNMPVNGIFLLEKSSATSIDGNKVTNSGKYGIGLQSSSAQRICSNTVDNSPLNGIFLLDKSSATSIEGNTVTNSDKYGIALQGSTAQRICDNTVEKAGFCGIAVIKSSKANTVTGNTLTSTGTYGVYVKNESSVGVETGNIVS